MTDPALNDASQNERLDEILAAYLDSERSGQRLDRQRLLAEHSDLADELRAFFADHDRMKAVAEPLRVADAPKGESAADEATLITSGQSAVDDVAGSLRDTVRVAERLGYDGKKSSVRPGSVIRYFGDYELLSEIARGGMGVVFKARQVKLNRVVALKMILAGQLASADDVRRFYVEAEAAANLDHPGIVPIFEVGEHGGQHFFSMGFVDGKSLAAKISGVPLEPREAAELLVKIAEAVQFAHDNGVIHRDLKPANVLLDKKDQPRVTDFGLAKQIRGDSNLTGAGQIIGTPSYMPPEQAAGQIDQIGPAADVYSLGAILYAALTGRPPFQAASPLDTVMQVLDREPVSPRHLNGSVPRDLETICLKCLSKEPLRRYASAQELADELQRFINDEPILARPIGPLARSWRWCLRNRTVASLTAMLFVFLIAFPIGATIAAVKLRYERNVALKNLDRATRAEADATDQRNVALTSLDRATRAEADATEKLWGSYLAQARAGRWSGRAGRRFDGLDLIGKAAAIRPSAELRNEAIACMALVDLSVAQQWEGCPAKTQYIAFDDNLERYARADALGNVSVRRVDGDQELARMPADGKPLQFFGFLGFSPDGQFLAMGYRDIQASHFQVWDLKRNKLVLSVPNGINLVAADFSLDSRRVAVGHSDSSISIYELPSGTLWKRLPAGANPYTLRFHPDGSQLAVSSRDANTVQIRDLETGAVQRSIPMPGQARGIAWHPHGKLMAASCSDNRVYIWDTSSGQRHAVLEGHLGSVTEVAFSHSGDLLASTGWDGHLKLWNPWSSKELVDVPRVWTSGYTALRFRRDDQQFGYGLVGSKIILWNVANGSEARTLGVPVGSDKQRVWSLDVSRNGRLVATAWSDGVRIWDIALGKEVARLPGHTKTAVFDPAGSDLFTWGTSGLARWPIDVKDGASDPLIGTPQNLSVPGSNQVEFGAISNDGRTIAVSDRSSAQVFAYDVASQSIIMREAQSNPSRIAISPNGKWVASGTWKDATSRVRIWDVAAQQHVRDLPLSDGARIGFTSDNKWLVTHTGVECRFWEVGTWKSDRAIAFAGSESFALSRDGKMMAVSAAPGLVSLLDQKTGVELATLPILHTDMCFSPDGLQLLAMTEGQELQIWDLRRIRAQLASIKLDWGEQREENGTSRPRADSSPNDRVQADATAPVKAGATTVAAATDPKSNPIPITPTLPATAVAIPSHWKPLELVEFSSAGGATLNKLDDGSILASGKNAATDMYEIVANTDLKKITGLRLDVLKHDSLPSGGPGRLSNGTFILSRVEIKATPQGGSETAQPIALTKATADYTQEGSNASNLIDGKPGPGWAIWDNGTANHHVEFQFDKPLTIDSGAKLIVTLKHESSWADGNIGCFRLSVTSGERKEKEATPRP